MKELSFETDEDAQRELDALRKKIESLTAAVELSLQAARKPKPDILAKMCEAERVLLTSTHPARVAHTYHRALDGAGPLYC